MTVYQLNKIVSILFIFVCIPLTPIIAFEYRDFLVIDKLLESCYKDKNSCNSALIKIHNYQQNAVINKLSVFQGQSPIKTLNENQVVLHPDVQTWLPNEKLK